MPPEKLNPPGHNVYFLEVPPSPEHQNSAHPCDFCEIGTCQPTITHTYYDYTKNNTPHTIRASLAGYDCDNPDCGISTLDLDATVQMLESVARIIRQAGDFDRAELVEDSLRVSREVQRPSSTS